MTLLHLGTNCNISCCEQFDCIAWVSGIYQRPNQHKREDMTDATIQAEQTFIENEFGTVTSKRGIYYREKGWFSGGSREDIPLQHVTSVRLDIKRSLLGGLLLLFIGVGMLGAEGGLKIVGMTLVLFAILFLCGSPTVVVNTAGRDLNASKGLPWKRGAANAFVMALRQQLFNKAAA